MPEPVIIKVGADLSELTAKLESFQNQIDELKGSARQSGEELKKSFTGATGAMNDVKMSAKQLDAEIRAVNESIKKTNDPKAIAALKEYRQELIAEEAQLGKTTQKFESMRGKIMAIKNELFKLRAEGKQGTVRFQELTTELGRLGDMKDDINELGKAMSSDTRHIDGMIQGVQGLVGAFSIFQGVQTLVGSENKEFQQAMMKMMATMQILNGVQQVANILQKESALMQTLQAVKTKILAGAKVAETVATEGATVAQLSLNAAMLANPVGIVIAAVAALAAGLIYFASQSDKAAIAQYNFNEALKKADELTNKLSSSMDKYIHMRKIQGASEEELTQLQIDKLKEFSIIQHAELKKQLWNLTGLTAEEKTQVQKKIDNWKNLTEAERAELSKQFGNMKNLTDEQKEELKKRHENLTKTNEEIIALERKKDEIIAGQNKEAEKLHIQNMKDGLEKEIALIRADEKDKLAAAGTNNKLRKEIVINTNKRIAEVRKKYRDEEKKALEEQKRPFEQAYYEQMNLMRKNIEEQQKLLKEENKYVVKLKETEIDEITKLEQKRLSDTENYWNLVVKNTKDGSEANTNALLKLEKIRYKKELKEKGNTTDLIEQIELNHQNNINKIQEGASNKRLENIKSEVNRWAGALTNAIDIYLKFEQQQMDQQLNNINKVHDAQIEKNQTALDKGLISQEQFNKESEKLEKDRANKERKIRREAWEKEKKAALAKAAINIALGVVSSLSGPPTYKWIEVGLVIAAGAAEMALIGKQQNPYRKGTAQILGGNSHEGGGVDLGGFGTAEKGEMIGILNKHKTKTFGKPMMDLFDGINKGNDSKMLKGLSGLVISAMPEIRQGNQTVNVPKQPELAKMLQIMEKPQETITIIGNKKIIKKGNYTRIVHL